MKRTRLSPEARKAQLLDTAKSCILEAGLQQFSLKKLAVEAGVSEPLLFHYFSCRLDLLQQLLDREFTRTINELNRELDTTKDLNDILRVYANHNYDRQAEEAIIDVLLSDPEVARIIEVRRTKNAEVRGKILVDNISKALGITRQKAAMIARMGSAASIAASHYATSSNMSRDEAIQTVIEFVSQGFESQRKN